MRFCQSIGQSHPVCFKLPDLFDSKSYEFDRNKVNKAVTCLQKCFRYYLKQKTTQIIVMKAIEIENISQKYLKTVLINHKHEINTFINSLVNYSLSKALNKGKRFRNEWLNKPYRTLMLPKLESGVDSLYYDKIQSGYASKVLRNSYIEGDIENNTLKKGIWLSSTRNDWISRRTSYYGSFKNDLKNGAGCLLKYQNTTDPYFISQTEAINRTNNSIKENYVYRGSFENGYKQGIGCLITKRVFALGEFDKGKLKGKILVSNPHDSSTQFVLYGYFNNNKPNGRAIVKLFAVKIGVFRYEGYINNGIVTSKQANLLRFRDKHWEGRYLGPFLRTKASGIGALHCFALNDCDSIVYRGQFKAGYFHGEGLLRKANASVVTSYKGSFTNGFYQGYGVLEETEVDSANKVLYSGNFVSGIKSGEGQEYVFSEFGVSKYKGKFRNGIRHGYGTVTFARHADERRHSFYGLFSSGSMSAEGKMTYTNGDICEGSFVNTLPHGANIKMHFKNGDYYVGCFKQGLFHGKGKLLYDNGDEYSGDYVDGKRMGHGKLLLRSNGMRYEGLFVMDLIQGRGNMRITTNIGEAVYQGDFIENKRNGFGVYCFENGNEYKGTFRNNMRHGKGIMKFKSGPLVLYEGDFLENEMTGKATATYRDGSIYTGTYLNGNRDGSGSLKTLNGEVYKGSFKDDKKHGSGIVDYANGGKFKGAFAFGFKVGEGIHKVGRTGKRTIKVKVLSI